MSKGKYSKNRGLNLRPIVLMLAVALLVGATIGGTIAWLTAQTPDVTNTFTVGDVDLTLKESKLILKENGDIDYNEKGEMKYEDPAEGVTSVYPMIPGNTYKKDPVVAVVDTETLKSEDCYLFVKFEESENPSTYINYNSTLTTENGWTAGQGEGEGKDGIPTNVWYRTVLKNDTNKEWHLLENDQIVINAETVTKSSMNTAANAVLKYTAYAVQKANLTVEQAWEKVTP